MTEKAEKKPFPGCTPGDEWNHDHLAYFKIHIRSVGAGAMFGVRPEDLPSPQFRNPKFSALMGPQNLADTLWPPDFPYPDPDDKDDNEVWQFLYLIFQCQFHNVTESYTNELVSQLFAILQYSIMHKRVVRPRTTLPLDMSGGKTFASPDLCIMTVGPALFILACQEDKRNANDNTDAAPQLIAEIIASAQSNIRTLTRTGKPSPELMLIPGILMHGTYPMFYLVPVTPALADHVRAGTRPPFQTIALRYAPRCARDPFATGMVNAENRHAILKAYEAFRQFIPLDMYDTKLSTIPPHLKEWFLPDRDHDPEAYPPETSY